MKILLTGGTGVIGQNLIPFLIDHHHELCLIVRKKAPIIEKLSPKQLAKCSFILWNDVNEELLITFSPTAVIHLAGYSTSQNDLKAIDNLISANIVLGTKLLHHLQGVKSLKYFINIGSASEYYNNSKTPNPTNLYAASKTAFRSFLSYHQCLFGFKTVHIVLYNVYGMTSTNKRVMDYLLDGLENDSPIDVSPGHQKIDFIHIKDVLSFFSALIDQLSNLHVDNKEIIFYVGTGEMNSLQDVVKLLEYILDKKINLTWGGIPYRDRDPVFSVAPIKKNGKVLKWKPNITLEKGLRMWLNKAYK